MKQLREQSKGDETRYVEHFLTLPWAWWSYKAEGVNQFLTKQKPDVKTHLDDVKSCDHNFSWEIRKLSCTQKIISYHVITKISKGQRKKEGSNLKRISCLKIARSSFCVSSVTTLLKQLRRDNYEFPCQTHLPNPMLTLFFVDVQFFFRAITKNYFHQFSHKHTFNDSLK